MYQPKKIKRMCNHCEDMCDDRFLYDMRCGEVYLMNDVCLKCLCYLKWI